MISAAWSVAPAAVWEGFVARSVAPVLPEGHMVLDGQGQWLGLRNGRITHEASIMLLELI